MAYKQWGGVDGFTNEKLKRQAIAERRMNTRNRNAKDREASLKKALAKENIILPNLERGASTFERRLHKLTTNYIKHGSHPPDETNGK